jgi:hypothetical protein
MAYFPPFYDKYYDFGIKPIHKKYFNIYGNKIQFFFRYKIKVKEITPI